MVRIRRKISSKSRVHFGKDELKVKEYNTVMNLLINIGTRPPKSADSVISRLMNKTSALTKLDSAYQSCYADVAK